MNNQCISAEVAAGGAVHRSKLLIVDDDESSVRLLQVTLRNAGYSRLDSQTDPREVPRHCAEFEPDLLLIDFLMPHLDGLQVAEQLQTRMLPGPCIPFLILTADSDPAIRQRALSIGANDFVTKPFDQSELVLRIRNLLELRRRYVEVHVQNQILREQALESNQALDHAQRDVVKCLTKVASYRDGETGEHAQRVGELAALIGRSIGLCDDAARLLGVAATLHDIGKVGIPDCILRKRGKLSSEEFDLIRKHTVMGAEILAMGDFSLLKLAQEIALYHHERWDGGGYIGMKGEEIPIAARIVALADTFDVLTHDRPYRVAWSTDRALAEIRLERGRQFDPRVVDAFWKGNES